METWNANLKRALRKGCVPVVKAELRGMSTAFLEVRDYTAGAGDSFSLVRNGSTVLTLTEGLTPFIAETSNEQTAINIVNAINTVGGFKVQRFGSRLKIRGGGAGTLSMAVTSTDENAWGEYRTGFPNRVVFCSHADACNGKYGKELLGMGSSGSSFDLLERKYTLATYDLVLSAAPGSWGRQLVTSVPLKGQIVEIYIGELSVSESDYERIATMVIMDYRLGDNEISLQLAEPIVYAADAEVSAHFIAMHPMDVLKWAWAQTKLDPSFYDVASLDSTADDEISHWLTSAHSYHFWSAPPNDAKPPGGFENAKLKAVIDDAQKILPGMVRRDSAGVLEYVAFDPEASTVRHFAQEDRESVEYETLSENQYTAVAALAPESEMFGGGKNVLFRVRDTQAQALTEADESDDGQPTTLKVESRFFGTPAWLRSGVSAAATTLEIWHATVSGISGCRTEDDGFSEAEISSNFDRPEYQRLRFFSNPYPSATQRSGDEADSGASPARLAHYLISDGSKKEIVAVTATAPPAAGNQYWYRPAAYLAVGSGGGTTVDGDQTADTTIRVDDASVFSMSFPYVTFASAGTFKIRSINYVTETLELESAATVSDGEAAAPTTGRGFSGGFEVAFGTFNDPIRSVYFPGHIEATVTRGALRSAAQAWSQAAPPEPDGFPRIDMTPQVYDLTIAKRICEMQLERFRYGCPIARLIVGLDAGDLQEGDFISFEDDRFLWMDHEGADSGVIWEIIGKRTAPIGDSPRVELTVAWVRSETIPYATIIEPVWEIPVVSPVLPVPTLTLEEPYYDLDGAAYLDTLGALYYPI